MKKRTFIIPHIGELDKPVLKVLKEHPEWWGGVDLEDLLHTDFYDVISDTGDLVGFFDNAHWLNTDGTSECVLCCVYVYEEYRKQGIFKKMVKYTIDHNTTVNLITIGAMDGNDLAHTIYNKMFRYSHHDDEAEGDFYIIRDRRP